MRSTKRRSAKLSVGAWRSPILLAIVLLLLTVGAIIAWITHLNYKDSRSQVVLRTAGMTRVLAEYTLRNATAVDLTLRTLIDRSPIQVTENDPELRSWMRRRLSDLPDVRALFVIGADGFIRHDTDYPITPRVSLADREYFRFHEQSGSDALYIGRPLLSRSVDRWFVSVSRRIEGPDGEFAGIAVAAVEPNFYERIYRDLPLGPQDSIALWHEDGYLIARFPDDLGMVGRKISQLPIFDGRMPIRETGTMVIENAQLGEGPRVVGYQRLPDMPLVVTTALSLQATLNSLRGLQIGILAIFLLLCASTIALSVMMFRRIREKEERLRRDLILQKAEALGRMTSGVAHDFNNVLAAADAGIKLAARHAADAEKVREFTSAATEAVERGAQLAAQLLQFAKQNELSFEKADVNQLLRRLEPMLRQSAKDVEIRFDLADHLPNCLLDRTQFDSAILNLIINARDAMSDGGNITISTREFIQKKGDGRLKPGIYVRVEVCDNGPGIPPELQQKVFEPYFSTKGEKGTGLGLPQVRGFVEQIGGHVRISSQAGEGARIQLFFPCGKETGAATPSVMDTTVPT